MRIAFVADGSHPNCFRWAEHYARLGETVAIFDFIERPFTANGVEHVPIASSRSFGKARYLVSRRAARSALRSWRPDIVIGYRLVSFGFVAARSGFRPLILAAQGQNLVPPGAPIFAKAIVQYAISKADLLHAWSGAMAKKMIEFGADPDRILVRPRGISLATFARKEVRATRPTLISTRILSPYYNQRFLLEGLKKLRTSVPDIELVVAGAGNDEDYLKRRAEQLGVSDNVRFVGVLPTDRLVSELSRAWVYVSAVPTDGVSSALLEAMACGCFPVVVNNEPNREWIRDEASGLTYRSGDVEEFVGLVMQAVTSQRLRDEAARRNTEILRSEADWERNMRDFLAAYRRLIAGRRTRSGEESGSVENGGRLSKDSDGT